ncbi:hypothetical protein HK101_000350 [Irineochytrium annulatum]|nr:hypothetical protein HK101_000350 [Irineochytrium annulatum]
MIVMDEPSYELTKLSHAVEGLGAVLLKGSNKERQIFGVRFSEAHADDQIFGYNAERKVICDAFEKWIEDGAQATILVEAPSGYGKSCLANLLMDRVTLARGKYCLTQGDFYGVPFKGLAHTILYMMDIIKNEPIDNQRVDAEVIAAKIREFSEKQYGPFCLVTAHFFAGCGIDLELEPLLLNISAAATVVKETKTTAKLDAGAKMNFVKTIVVQIFIGFARRWRTVFLFDDMQWFDSWTIDILSTVAKSCPSKAIDKKTSGNPLYLQTAIDILISKVGSVLSIKNNVLVAENELVDIEPLLLDHEAVILFQFDQLNDGFQNLLKFAAFSGQVLFLAVFAPLTRKKYFNVEDTLRFGDFNMSLADAWKQIEQHDVYKFLVCQKIATTNDSPSSRSNCSIFFRHITISNAIYNSFPYEFRMDVNGKIAEVLEGQFVDDDSETAANLLGRIDFHYSRTKNVSKIVHYKVKLGYYCHQPLIF